MTRAAATAPWGIARGTDARRHPAAAPLTHEGRTRDLGHDPRPVPVSRRRVLARTRLDFWLDAALLTAYTLAYSLGFTGIAAHEWLGIGLGAALLVHLTLHWDWVTRTTGRLLRRDGRERFIWLVNLLLLVAMTLCVASGILISEVALPQLGVRAFRPVPSGGRYTTPRRR